MSMYGSLAAVSTGSNSGDASGTTSCHQTSRPAVHGTSSPVRRRTRQVRTPGAWAIASSATAFMGTVLPRRRAPSVVISRLASPSCSREPSASGPNPENIGRKMAPSLPRARTAATVSGSIGMNTPTRSPRSTPSWRRAFARRFVSSCSSRKVSRRTAPSSPSQISAVRSPPGPAACRSRALVT